MVYIVDWWPNLERAYPLHKVYPTQKVAEDEMRRFAIERIDQSLDLKKDVLNYLSK